MQSRITMLPNANGFVCHTGAPRAHGDGARAERLSKPMMMPITTPTEAGRTRAF